MLEMSIIVMIEENKCIDLLSIIDNVCNYILFM